MSLLADLVLLFFCLLTKLILLLLGFLDEAAFPIELLVKQVFVVFVVLNDLSAIDFYLFL